MTLLTSRQKFLEKSLGGLPSFCILRDKTLKRGRQIDTMSAWLSLTILMVVIFHIYTAATESISSLDTMAIYDGLLAPENIIGTNLQVTKTIVYGPSRSSFCLSLAFCVDHLSINPTKRRVQQCTTRTIAKLLRKNPPESSQFEL